MGLPISPTEVLLQGGSKPGFFRGPQAREQGEESSGREIADRLELNGARLSYLQVSLQLHLEKNVFDRAAEVIGRESVDILFEYRRLEVEVNAPPPAEGEGEDKATSAIDRLMEYFSPERTAQRIADFVIRGFGRTCHTDRGAFVSFLMPFIRQGVDEALALFGELPEEIVENAEETYKLTEELLTEFAQTKEEF